MLLPLTRGVNVFGHKDVSKTATACPGQLDQQWIVNRANEIILAMETKEPVPAPDFSELTEAITGLSRLIQQLLDLLKSIFRLGER